MRRLLLVPAVMTAFFTISLPHGGDQAEAKNLFEALFPRAAKRRRKRIQAERARVKAARRARDLAAKRRASKTRAKAVVKKKTRRVARARSAAALASTQNRYFAYRADKIDRILTAPLAKRLAKQGSKREAAREKRRAKLRQDRIGRIAIAAAASNTSAPKLDMITAAPHLLQVNVQADTPVAKALRAHYTANPAFLWLDGEGRANEASQAVMALFADAAAEGLDPSHYTVPDLPDAPLVLAGIDVVDSEAWAKRLTFEIAMSARALRYMRDAQHGRIIPSRMSTYHDFSRNRADEEKLIGQIAEAEDKVALLKSAHPAEPAYAQMKATLAEERGGLINRPEPVSVPARTFVKPAGSSEFMAEIVRGISLKGSPELKRVHAETFKIYDGSPEYSETLVALVKDFQKEKGLGPDGIIGRNTLRQLVDGPKVDRTRALTLAMERLRWHPSKLGARHVFINQPEFRVRYMVNGEVRLGMNAVVGKKSNQTNFFHDEIEYVEFNPYWGVPLSIKQNEMLPKLRRDPSYLDRNGYEVTNGRGRKVASSSVDWWNVDERFPYDVRQKPGRRNALGQLKIMFPNRHSIYMHDTPAKKLFARPVRAYSHGCVRLADPKAMAAAVLGTTIDNVQGRIDRGKNNALRLKTKVPVYVAYFTAWPNADGTMGYHQDIYGRDRTLETALRVASDERMNADEDI